MLDHVADEEHAEEEEAAPGAEEADAVTAEPEDDIYNTS